VRQLGARLYERARGSLLALLIALPTAAQVTGDLNSSSGNNNSTVGSNNPTSNETKNYNGAGSAPFSQPVPTAAAPTVMGGGGSDSCLIPVQQAFQISIFGKAEGKMIQDPECGRIKKARLLGTPQAGGGLGLQISGISVMCGSPEVFKAMALASTPCPIYSLTEGRLLVGRDAYIEMRTKPDLYVIGYDDDRAFWDGFLLMGQELPDVIPIENSGPSLSDRFRRNTGGGGSDDSKSNGIGADNP
jgi:hypothetical protein